MEVEAGSGPMEVEARTTPAGTLPASAGPDADPSAFELTAAMDRGTALMTAASAETLRHVAAFDQRMLWGRDGATSMSAWLAARYHLAKGTAREWVRVAHAMEQLPSIAATYARGRLSWDQLRPLTRFATMETDEHWANKARQMSPAALWAEARRHERVAAREAEDAHRRRYLNLWWDPEKPLLYIDGMLPGEQGRAVEEALTRRAEQLPPDPEAASPGEARVADAFTDLATAAGPGGAASPTLVIHADAEVLSGNEPADGPSLSETDGGQRLAAGTIRRLACDGLAELVLEKDGVPVGIGRRSRTVPGQIERALRHRDRGCRFPGCERTKWVHAHHLVHWADGGATNLDNLALLCSAHHRLIHEGGWRTSGHPGRNLRFHDPGGRMVPDRPP
ncbi:MAG TPA: DUF222 domain-containing protein [Actinomycetota bacterium]|nr:DUF222 domain-containing protein [Actinomycetota bacterium]